MQSVSRTTWMVGAIATLGAMLLMASPASAGTIGSPAAESRAAAVASRPHQLLDFDAQLTALQVEQLQQLSKTAGDIGIMAQGGFDRDHWWFKISKAEVISIGVGVVCRAVFGGAGWFVCPPLTAAVNWALSQFPNAGGFWAEVYTDGRVRVGTW